jgi:UDP-glucose 4-epimerase
VRELLGWQPRYQNLELIVEQALAWERSLAEERAA